MILTHHYRIGGLVVKLAVAISWSSDHECRPAPGSIPGRCIMRCPIIFCSCPRPTRWMTFWICCIEDVSSGRDRVNAWWIGTQGLGRRWSKWDPIMSRDRSYCTGGEVSYWMYRCMPSYTWKLTLVFGKQAVFPLHILRYVLALSWNKEHFHCISHDRSYTS
jgi:hypothetical protein